MKRIITPGIKEESIYFCDKHPDRECFTEIKTIAWYGSKFDGDNLTIHLCDVCYKEFLTKCKKKYGVEPSNSQF
jgi:hypothetical protein